MTDPHFIKDIFQRYLDNNCSTYEIKFLLKHFISGDSETELRGIIAEKLKDYSIDATPELQGRSVYDHNFNNILRAIETDEEVSTQTVNNPYSKTSLIIKITALVTTALIVLEGFYVYYKPAGPQSTLIARFDANKNAGLLRRNGVINVADSAKTNILRHRR